MLHAYTVQASVSKEKGRSHPIGAFPRIRPLVVNFVEASSITPRFKARQFGKRPYEPSPLRMGVVVWWWLAPISRHDMGRSWTGEHEGDRCKLQDTSEQQLSRTVAPL
jgi:hypothetical protein